MRFVNGLGKVVQFDENGDPPAFYDLINWQKISSGDINFEVVGSYDSSSAPEEQFQIDEKTIVWNTEDSKANNL